MVLAHVVRAVYLACGCSLIASRSSEWRFPICTKGVTVKAQSAQGDRSYIGDLLSDLPTPILLIELSLAENALSNGTESLDFVLDNPQGDSLQLLDGSLFVHTKVTSTEARDKISRDIGSGKSTEIGNVDVPASSLPGGAFLGIGLANHHVGGYYWARGMGMGASLPAHGVEFGPASEDEGLLFWRKRGPGSNAKETTEESSNSNDGKRSEWADFLSTGDTVQLVPKSCPKALTSSPFETLVGVRRIGRPLGADPVVERVWRRSPSTMDCWHCLGE